jgi:integrase
MKLKDTTIKAAKPKAKPYRLSDGRGLFLEINPNGSRYWRFRYRITGKENMAALGVYELGVSLADARKRRDEAAALVEQGIHPAQHKKARRTQAAIEASNTFEGIARTWMEETAPHWSPRYLENVEAYMGKEVFPRIGHMPIKAIKASDVLAILRTMGDRGAETAAGLVRMWVSQVYKHAVRNLLAESDPTEVLKGAIRRPPVQHKRPLSGPEIGDMVLSIEGYTGQRDTAIALHLLLLTFVRPGEIRAAEWSEFDLERRTWVIPAERMKMGTEHTVPLSAQAIALLEELSKFTGNNRFLFPNQRTPDAPLGKTTLNAALRHRIGMAGFSAHGFRATASTLLNAQGYPADVIERQLAHQERNKVRAAYNHHQYMPERTAMMTAWADLIDQFTKEAREGQKGREQ